MEYKPIKILRPLTYLIVFPLCGLLLAAQGFGNSGQPVPQVKQLKQQIDKTTTSRCAIAEDFGCAEINAVGSLSNSTFKFQDLFVTCGVSDQGIYVRMSNSLSNYPTFQLNVNLWYLTEPPNLKVCKGVETFEDLDSQVNGIKTGACELIVRIHNNTLAASESRQCLVVFEQDEGEPWRGTIQCQMLEQFGKYLIIEKTSKFQCPAA